MMTARDESRPTRVAVVGLGTMGIAIARLFENHGHEIRVFDTRVQAADPPAPLAGMRLQICTTIRECVQDADFVFEAVSEDLAVKESVLREVSRWTAGIIASNTSTFMPRVLAAFVARPENLLVAHFFNPADVVPLVEVVPHAGTAIEARRAIERLLRDAGKKVVLLEKECVGFVANRLQAAVLRESLSLIEQGVVSAEDLDEVVRSALAPRWAIAGPLGVADLGGLDVFVAVCTQIFPDLSAAQEPSPLLTSLVDSGRIGAKAGSGFYPHSDQSARESMERIAGLFASLAHADPTTPERPGGIA
ncbi:3-hydroxyacyl-CoA dehydrogenase family protein [Microbacterium saperdae]|uniref:3-hydroxybutyryl-CoA dehydrogenase n=1 Tax=Microbacterium saperdae TaxID=69368 RepID=A0A543B9T7_9MICO|nr:3-hydroxyacyl-CoA dehydrogenase NAD-binding domain-containing protein [Microbacterium saperdae]TQL81615.1 3-hydroxybutyryl-CoA dehydrogenase [Microbacterium saperdae]